MNRRARRIALLTVGAGCLVIAGLVAFNWATVRDHAEAWWFQVTRETQAFRPEPGEDTADQDEIDGNLADGEEYLSMLSPEEALETLAMVSKRVVVYDPDCLTNRPYLTLQWKGALQESDIVGTYREAGYRILAQRFPGHAYVVTGYPDPVGRPWGANEAISLPPRLRGGAGTTLELKAGPR